MSMGWVKCGRILDAPWRSRPFVSHAAVPIAECVGGNLHRVYYSPRDEQNRSYVSRSLVDFGPTKPTVLQTDVEPLLSPGRPGAFDDSGAMGTWLVSANSRKYLYYIGWNLGSTVPFRNAIGVAISDDGGASFVRHSEGPILDRDTCDPFFIGSACVLIENDTWRMWYVSCVGWVIGNGVPTHRYHIKYAESKDGLRWNRTGIVAVDFASVDEYAISRPCVVLDGRIYRMWYSYRGEAYRIGYAESDDGITWRRDDQQVGIEPGPDAWDSEMLEYPFVFDVGDRRYMLYNGNDYGRAGIGVAILEHLT
jgi:hypothetical protein